MSDYEYKGLMAEAWDVLRGDTSRWADRFFYLEAVQKYGQPVLDIGCGTGRLLLDYLGQGIDVDGVDNSPEMLALCRVKARALGLEDHFDHLERLYEQPMEELRLPRAYRTILIPSSSLQLVVDADHALQAVRRIYAHLEPGGALAASFMTLWAPGEPLESSSETSARRPADGALFRRHSRSRYDPGSECEHTEDLYQVLIDGQVIAQEQHRRSPATRSYTQAQAQRLMEQAGFAEVRLYHEFTWQPAAQGSGLFTVVAQKAGLSAQGAAGSRSGRMGK